MKQTKLWKQHTDNNDAVKYVGYTGDFKNASEKGGKLKRLMKAGLMNEKLIKYLPNMKHLRH